MVERRTLLSGGAAAGLGALLGAAPAAAAAAQDPTDDGAEVARAIDALRRSLEDRDRLPAAVGRVREQQRVYLRANRKYPDFVEVGLGVWDAVHDWYLARRQTPPVGVLADGRYGMSVLFTTIVLRPDQDDDYVGFGFDAARPGA